MGWFERHWHKAGPQKGVGMHLPESELEQGESKFRFLFENIRNGVMIFQVFNDGEDFVIIDFNSTAEQIEDIKRESVIGKNVVEVFPGFKEMGLLDVFLRVWRTGSAEFNQATLYRDMARTGWRESYVYKLPTGEIVLIYNDVTERKRAELALRMSEQKFRAIADYTYHWESWVGPTGVLFWVNPAVERISGYTVDECMKMADYPMPLIHEPDRKMMADVLEEARKGGSGKDIEFRVKRKDGKVICGEMAWQGIYDNKGIYQGYRASIDDITERALAQEALKVSEERYRALVENVELGIMMVDIDRTILTVNSGMAKLFGRSASDFVGKKCDEFFLSENAKGGRICPGDIALEECGRVVMEMEAVRANGSRFPARVQAFPVYATGELSAYFIEVIEDITEDKLAKEKLRQSEERYRSFVQNFNGIAFRAKADFSLVFMHGMVREITGYSEREILRGKPRWDQLVAPADSKVMSDADSRRLQTVAGFSCEREYRIIHKDGRIRWVHEISRNVSDRDGKVAFIQGAVYDITDRRRAEEELEKLANLPNENPHAILRITASGTILYNNNAAEPILAKWQVRRGDPAPEEWHKKVIEAVSSGVICGTGLDCGGRIFSLEFVPIAGSDYVNVYGFDITQRRRAEAELLKEEEKYHDLVETMNEGLGVVGKEYIFTYVNKRFAEMLGYKQDEITGHYVTEFMDEQSRQMMGEQMSQRRGGISEPYDVTWVAGDGHKVYTWVSPKGMYDEQGNFQGSIGVIMDISERKKAEEKLRSEEKKYRDLVETMHEGMGIVDKDYVLTYINKRLAEMLGYKSDEMLGHQLTDFLDEKNKQIMLEQRTKRQKGEVSPYEISWTARDGRKVYTLVSPKILLDEAGNFHGVLGVVMDITEIRQAEEKLHIEEKKYHDIVDLLAEGIGISDENYIFTYVNKRFAGMLGCRQDEMTGHHVTDFMDERNKQMMAEQIAKRKQGTSEPYEVTWQARDGHKVHTMVSPKGIFDEGGNFRGSFGVLVDITERKRTEMERESLLKILEQKNRELESILHIASHDLKSAVLSIAGLSDGLKASCEMMKLVLEDRLGELDEKSRTVLDKDIPEMVASIMAGARKMDSLLSSVLQLAQVDSVKLNIQEVNMDEILASLVESMQVRIKEKDAVVEVEAVPRCMGDTEQITQVFANLLDNAIKFLSQSRPGRIRVSGSIEQNDSIYCIEDNGIGIERQYYEKIFDAFYQYGHEEAGGRGLGLTIVRRIVERHKGKVWVESQFGKGSRFYVSLPRQ